MGQGGLRLAAHDGRVFLDQLVAPKVWNHYGIIMVSAAMPTNMTLKNIPDDVYERLKESARRHRRSMNSEAIVCLEKVLNPVRLTPTERLERARRIREEVGGRFLPDEIDRAKREGRP